MEIKCPKCGASVFDPDQEPNGCYVCHNKPNDSEYVCCEIIGAICKQCNEFHYFDSFGLHGDVYECKECGRVNWPLTDYIRKIEEEKNELQKILDRTRMRIEAFEKDAKKLKY